MSLLTWILLTLAAQAAFDLCIWVLLLALTRRHYDPHDGPPAPPPPHDGRTYGITAGQEGRGAGRQRKVDTS